MPFNSLDNVYIIPYLNSFVKNFFKESEEPKICIAIAKPQNVVLLDNVLENCYNHNPDGAGFAYLENDGELVVHKGFFTFDSFLEAYKPHENKQALLHFRIKTHGDLSVDNCHPFVVNDEVAFIHNGIISASRSHAKMSDTAVFNEDILKPLVEQFGEGALQNDVVKTLIEQYIGSSKLAFIDSRSKQFNIFNKEMGNVTDEVWFSNLSWQDRPKVKAYTQTKPAPYPEVYTPWNDRWSKTAMYGGYDDEVDLTPFVVDELKSYANDYSLHCGDMVAFEWEHTSKKGVKCTRGMIGEIEDMYSDRIVDVLVYKQNGIKEEFITGVPFYALRLVKEEEMLC